MPPPWTRPRRRVCALDLAPAPGTGCCGLGPLNWAASCRRSSSGGATSPPATLPRCVCTSGRRPMRRKPCPPSRRRPRLELATLVLTAPMMAGAEHLTTDVLAALWTTMADAMAASLAASGNGLQDALKALNPAWNPGRPRSLQPGREPPRPRRAVRLHGHLHHAASSAQARAQHLLLGEALRAYAGRANRDKLLALLLPVQRAAERSAWLRKLVEDGDIYHPQRWGAADVPQVLFGSAADLEAAGIVLRMPAGWAAGCPARSRVTATIGGGAPSGCWGSTGCWTSRLRSRWTVRR